MARDNPREGDMGLSGSDKRGKDHADDAARNPSPDKAKRKGSGDDVSRVLKTVYDDTLREDVPKELRDLLDKLD